MTAQYNDQELIDRYLNGKLAPSERTAFEIRLLDEPQLLEQVQLVDAMKSALTSERKYLPPVNANGPRTGFRLIPLRLWMQQPLSLAACLMIVVFGLQMSHSRAPVVTADKSVATAATIQTLGVGGLVQLEIARGSEMTHASGHAPYLFKIDAGIGNDAAAFAFTLKNAVDQTVLTQAGLKADNEGWVWVVVNGQLAGDYHAELDWTDTNGVARLREFALTMQQSNP